MWTKGRDVQRSIICEARPDNLPTRRDNHKQNTGMTRPTHCDDKSWILEIKMQYIHDKTNKPIVCIISEMQIVLATDVVVACDIKLFWNNVEIISVFYFTYNLTTSETKIQLFQQLKLFQNYFSDIEHVGKFMTCNKPLK